MLSEKYLALQNNVITKSAEPSLYEERTQTPVDSIEFRWAQRKHRQRTGASTSLVHLHCGGLIHIRSWGQRFVCTGSLIRKILVAWGSK